jgi:hypothetical protein
MAKNRIRKPTRRDVKKAAGFNPIAALSGWGVRSNHAYLAGFASIGLSVISWLASRGKDDSRPQSDRWGLFIGEWAPTLFALGLALEREED